MSRKIQLPGITHTGTTPTCSPLTQLNTISGSLIHTLAREHQTTKRPSFFYIFLALVIAFVALGSMALASTLHGEPSYDLSFWADWNTLFQFGVTFPLLAVFTLSESWLIPERLNELVQDEVLALDIERQQGLIDVWSWRFFVTNILGQTLGFLTGSFVAYYNYLAATRSSTQTWQEVTTGFCFAGYVHLFWLGLFYALAVLYVFRSVTIVGLLYATTRDNAVVLIPFHPDGCGGLRPVGTIGLRNQYILAIAGVNVLLLVLVAARIPDHTVELDRLVLAASIFYLFGGPFAFLGPLMPFRSAMQSQKRTILRDVGRALRDHYVQYLRDLHDGVFLPQSQGIAEKLHDLQRTARRLPVWPFDTSTLRRFFGSYLFPVLLWLAAKFGDSFVPTAMKLADWMKVSAVQ